MKDAFALDQSAASSGLKDTLAEKQAQYTADGVDPFTVPAIEKLRNNGSCRISSPRTVNLRLAVKKANCSRARERASEVVGAG